MSAEGPYIVRHCVPPRMAADRPSVLEGTGYLMEWWAFPPNDEERIPTFSFEFPRDCDCGSLDHVHIELHDVPPLIRFLGGVPVTDLQRTLALLAKRNDLAGVEDGPGYAAALRDLAERLDLDEKGS